MRIVKIILVTAMLIALGLVVPRFAHLLFNEKQYFLEDGSVGYHTLRKGTEIIEGKSEWWDPQTGFRTCLQWTRNDQTDFEITYWSPTGELLRQEIQSKDGVEFAEGPPWLWEARDQEKPTGPWLQKNITAYEWIRQKTKK